MSVPQIIRCPDAKSVALAAAEGIRGVVTKCEAERGACRFALAGGATPKALYKLLAQRGQEWLPWSKVTLFWGDERAVPPDDRASNYRMVQRAMLGPIQPARVHRIEAERGAGEAAKRYTDVVGAAPLDLVLLGMGTDGHTASLFPDTPDLDKASGVVATTSAEPPHDRISLSLKLINAAQITILLVTGEEKAERLAEAYGEIAGGKACLPVSKLQPQGESLWIVDAAAAAQLPSGG